MWLKYKGMLLLLICIFNLLFIINKVGNFFKDRELFSWLIGGLYKFSRRRRLLNLDLASTCKISFLMSSWYHRETYVVTCVCKEDALDNVKLKESVWALFLSVCVGLLGELMSLELVLFWYLMTHMFFYFGNYGYLYQFIHILIDFKTLKLTIK